MKKINKVEKYGLDNLNPKTMNTIIKAYEKDFKRLEKCVNKFRKSLLEAKDIEDFMMAKTEYMIQLLTLAKPEGNTCYFCESGVSCEDCKYGKLKGICGWSKNNVYDKVTDAFEKVEDIIDNYYWSGYEDIY